MNAEATAYTIVEDDEESLHQNVTHHIRRGPRYNDWTPARGRHGVHRWIYKATSGHQPVGTRLGICVMGDVYGPYGHDHHKVLDWAWQTWPRSVRRLSSAGHGLPIVDMIKQHVQCEIDLHHASCELLSLLRVSAPLVFRPWLEVPGDPPWHVVTSIAGQVWTELTEQTKVASRVHNGPIVRSELVQAIN